MERRRSLRVVFSFQVSVYQPPAYLSASAAGTAPRGLKSVAAPTPRHEALATEDFGSLSADFGAPDAYRVAHLIALSRNKKHLPQRQVLSYLEAIDAGMDESSLKAKASLRGALTIISGKISAGAKRGGAVGGESAIRIPSTAALQTPVLGYAQKDFFLEGRNRFSF